MAMAILVNVSSTTTSAGNITASLGTYGCSSAKQVITGCTVLADTSPYYLSANGNQLSLYSVGLYSFPQKSGIYGSIIFPITWKEQTYGINKKKP